MISFTRRRALMRAEAGKIRKWGGGALEQVAQDEDHGQA